MAEEIKHSKFSASSAHRWMSCPGSMVLCAGRPNPSSVYADEGTAAHSLLADVVDSGQKAHGHIGRNISGGDRDFTVDHEMAAAVQTAADNIAQIAGEGLVLTEQRVNYSPFLEVPTGDAWGTSDIIAVRDDELQVHDFKYGRGVAVDAEGNEQMMLYALGALHAHDDTLGPFTNVRLVIHQPRIKTAPSEHLIGKSHLLAWGLGRARSAASSVQMAEGLDRDDSNWAGAFLNPGEDQCRFCLAKAVCPALRDAVADTLGIKAASPDEFANCDIECPPKVQDDAWLAVFMSKSEMILDWVKAVRAEVESRLLAGLTVPGWKLVQGKQGNRAWTNPAEAEAALKAMRLKVEEMYDLSLISPTSAEKLAKAKDAAIGPRQWAKLQPMISRSAGKPHVAPASDSRPALIVTPVAEMFDDVTIDDLA